MNNINVQELIVARTNKGLGQGGFDIVRTTLEIYTKDGKLLCCKDTWEEESIRELDDFPEDGSLLGYIWALKCKLNHPRPNWVDEEVQIYNIKRFNETDLITD